MHKKITVAKKAKGKGYDVNVGGRKKSGHLTKAAAQKAAKTLRKKREK